MKRTPLKRKAPLRSRRRDGADIEREPKPLARGRVEQQRKSSSAKEKSASAAAPSSTLRPLHRGTYAGTTTAAAPKPQTIHHTGYEKAVRDLGYCVRCGWQGRPQFCHKDAGKGTGVKTDSREGWAGCDYCHGVLGGHKGGGRLPKEVRRAEELRLAALTREAVNAAGTWPRTLPQWNENTK